MNRKGEKKNPSMRGLQSTDVRISTTNKSSHSSKLHDRVLKNTFWTSKYHVKGSSFLSIAIKYHNSLKRTSVNKKSEFLKYRQHFSICFDSNKITLTV